MNSVAEYYNTDYHVEWERLDRHPVELAVTMRAFNEFLPPPPARILDVGGGPGRYAVALAKQGYDVTLTDLAQESLKRAATYAQQANVQLADIRAANALDLSAFPASSYDALLFMGPLYHLTTSEDRVRAVREAWRTLKPNGKIFAAFLLPYSALRICAERFPQWLYENQDYADKILTTGVHSGEWGFTTAYYAHTKDVQPFMEAHGFDTLQLIGCEGIVGHTQATLNALTDAAWEWWADLNYRLGKEADLHSSSTHLLYVGRKRG
jgi:2-polyprenyl-3-methyl-5-hydroxy-6-metoxy-1,4-benzoquinol methylase